MKVIAKLTGDNLILKFIIYVSLLYIALKGGIYAKQVTTAYANDMSKSFMVGITSGNIEAIQVKSVGDYVSFEDFAKTTPDIDMITGTATVSDAPSWYDVAHGNF